MNRKHAMFCFHVALNIIGFGTSEISFGLDAKTLERYEQNVNDLIKKYYPHENSLCTMQLEPGDHENFPTFHLPVTVYNNDQTLRDCEVKPQDHDGYVFMSSNTTNLEEKIVPLLKCLNQSTLKIKTKYVLVLDSITGHVPYDAYSKFFNNLWKNFGLINIGILPVQGQTRENELPFITFYNPFTANSDSNISYLTINTVNQDLRYSLKNRFRNMNGYPLRAVFFGTPQAGITLENLKRVNKLGDRPAVLFKQTLESHLNISFDIYEPSNKDDDPDSIGKQTGIPLGEIINGKAEFCTEFGPSSANWPKTVQIMQIGLTVKFVILVPKPRQVESWQLFLYIFQWQVSLGLGLTLMVLSLAALLFIVTILKTNKRKHSKNVIPEVLISEVLIVWKAFASASINNLPTTHSQRSLVAISLLFGLIFITLFTASLFNLMKSRPLEGYIRSLQELQDSQLPIYLKFSSLTLIMDTFENTSLSQLRKNVKRDEDFENAKNLFEPQHLNISDRSVMHLGSLVNMITSQPQNRHFSKLFDILNEPITESLTVMYYPIGSAYFECFNELNLKLIAGGIYKKWYSAQNQQTVQRLSKLSPKSDQQTDGQDSGDGQVPLNYDDLKIGFYILYFGLLASAILFIKEVFSCKKLY